MEKRISNRLSESELDRHVKGDGHVSVGRRSVTSDGLVLLPDDISNIVASYYSSGKKHRLLKAALTNVKPITLCLSQDISLKIAPWWSTGFLPPEHPWPLYDVKIDTEHGINNAKDYFRFLDQKSSKIFRIRVDVLVVKLSMISDDSSNVLVDLRRAVDELHGHLNGVKYVVFSISEHASCCFSLKDLGDKVIAKPAFVDPQDVLLQVIDDLHACWKMDHKLTALELIAFYFQNDNKPLSEIHLVKCVILLDHPSHLTLLKKQSLFPVSNKIMWVSPLKSAADFESADPVAARLCHVAIVTPKYLTNNEIGLIGDRFEHAFCYRDSPFLQRIFMKGSAYNRALQLPQLNMSLAHPASFSALIELQLMGTEISFNLTDLNTGFFPRLAYLSILFCQMTGHLDSCRVPCLKTLILKLGEKDKVVAKLNKSANSYACSLLCSGRPWQLEGLQTKGAWSLASYVEPFTSTPDDVKDDVPHAPHSQQLLELLLVGNIKRDILECHSQFQGHSSLEAATDGLNDGLWIWSPERVQKITAYGMPQERPELYFDHLIPGQTRILTSLEVQDISIALNGAALPFLQSLEMYCSTVNISGVFPHLRVLTLVDVFLSTRWHLDTPLLHSFSYAGLDLGERVSIHPDLLPNLSVLKILPKHVTCTRYPEILVDEDGLGLSHVNYVEFGGGITSSPDLNPLRVSLVSNLALTIAPHQLPKCWLNTDWLCEELSLVFTAPTRERLALPEEPNRMVLPPLPLVKKLTVVTKKILPFLLNDVMPNLVECAVTSPEMLGLKFKCPALKILRFTGKLSDSDKQKCLDPATYVAWDAQPRMVYLDDVGKVHIMAWDTPPNDNESLPLAGHLEEIEHPPTPDE